MLITYIRSSSYNNYAYCQMQYFITYVLGHQSVSGKKAELGTIVHKVMECLAQFKKADQDASKRTRKLKINDDALKNVAWDRSDLFNEELVSHLLDLSYDFYTSTSVHDWYKSDKQTCRQLIWQTLDFNNGQFDPRKRQIVAPEPHFDIPIEEDWAKFKYKMPDGKEVEGQLAIKGTIDLVTQVDEDTIEVVDWKTGKRIDWATGEEKHTKNYAQTLNYYYIIMLFLSYFHNINKQLCLFSSSKMAVLFLCVSTLLTKLDF